MAWVLTKETQTKGTDRLVLLVLANHADDLWRAWPSVPRIAKQANVAERAVQRSLANLKALGIITVERQNAPDKRQSADRRTNLYYIHRGDADSTPRGDARSTPKAERGDAGGQNGVTLVTERGDAGDTQIIIEPKTESSGPIGVPPITAITPEVVERNTSNCRRLRSALRHGDAA